MSSFITRQALCDDLKQLGIAPGDTLMVHAAVSRVGPLLNGPDALIGAIIDAVGEHGTLMAYADWDARYEDLLDENGTVPEQWRPHIPPYDPLCSRAIRDNGVFPEFLRTTPGAVRSASPGASVVALGAKADWLIADHALDYGYGEQSPFAKLVEIGGKIAMIGAPLDTMTIVHHAEHLADVPGKRIKSVEVPFATPQGVRWRRIEEFDTGTYLCPALDDRDYFSEIAEAYLASGAGVSGTVGRAPTVIVDAAGIVPFAVDWIENHGQA